MKALKEKRIGLRSLWRRGLVILSLFALVFASCDSTDDDNKTTTPPSEVWHGVSSIQIIQQPIEAYSEAVIKGANDAELRTYYSYEGLPLTMKGLKVLVRYSDIYTSDRVLEWGALPADVTFDTYPPYAVGALGENTTPTPAQLYWTPVLKYELRVTVGDKHFEKEVIIPEVKPILRDPTWAKVTGSDTTSLYPMTAVGGGSEDNLSLSRGLNFTGDFGKKVYVDDYATKDKLSGYRLQAEYVDGVKKEIPLKADTEWAIKPSYKNTKKALGPGDLFVTVARNPLEKDDYRVTDALAGTTLGSLYDDKVFASADAPAFIALSLEVPAAKLVNANSEIDPALTVKHPYDAVYHVKSIELVDADSLKLPNFYFWMDDSPEAWVKTLTEAKARIKVTYYTDADAPSETKEFSVEEAYRMNNVWANYLGWVEEDYFEPFGVQGIQMTQGAETVNTRKETAITLNYRGQTTEVKVPVYTRLVGIHAQIRSGDPDISVDMIRSDNDKGGMTALEFSKLIDVSATFSSSFPNAPQVTLEGLTFDNTDITEASSTLGAPALPLKYSMNFGLASDPPAGTGLDTITGTWTGGWGYCDDETNNGRTKAVVVYYAVDVPKGETYGLSASSIRNDKVSVKWTNIHNKK